MGKNGSPAVGGRTAAAAAATVADATIGLAGLVVAMVMTGATPGKLEISNGGGVEADVDLGGARWITVEPWRRMQVEFLLQSKKKSLLFMALC